MEERKQSDSLVRLNSAAYMRTTSLNLSSNHVVTRQGYGVFRGITAPMSRQNSKKVYFFDVEYKVPIIFIE